MKSEHAPGTDAPDGPADPCLELAQLRRAAPPGFTARVLRRLPPGRPAMRRLWPEGWQWAAPALAGAAAALIAVFGLPGLRPAGPATGLVVVQFELHAPDAEQVELVGDFTDWQRDRIRLEGPDESGHWTARVELPEGRHEYIFLVDGRRWITDPLAPAHRPDGFGNLNAVMNL